MSYVSPLESLIFPFCISIIFIYHSFQMAFSLECIFLFQRVLNIDIKDDKK